MSDEIEVPNSRSRAGCWTVVGMFGFAGTMVLLLFVYWEFYTAPFRPLQYAINAEFPGSSPRVVGGKHKSHKNVNPVVLRVVVYVPDNDFNPEVDEGQSLERALALARLAFEHHDVTQYEQLQIVCNNVSLKARLGCGKR